MTNQSAILKKEKLKDEHFEVGRTRNCAECGSDEEMRWLTFYPSFNKAIVISSTGGQTIKTPQKLIGSFTQNHDINNIIIIIYNNKNVCLDGIVAYS